jgi:hypothetical protein
MEWVDPLANVPAAVEGEDWPEELVQLAATTNTMAIPTAATTRLLRIERAPPVLLLTQSARIPFNPLRAAIATTQRVHTIS